MGRERDKDQALTRQVAAELSTEMGSGTAFWDEFAVAEPIHRDNGAIYFCVESPGGGAKTYVIVSPRWIESWH